MSSGTSRISSGSSGTGRSSVQRWAGRSVVAHARRRRRTPRARPIGGRRARARRARIGVEPCRRRATGSGGTAPARGRPASLATCTAYSIGAVTPVRFSSYSSAVCCASWMSRSTPSQSSSTSSRDEVVGVVGHRARARGRTGRRPTRPPVSTRNPSVGSVWRTQRDRTFAPLTAKSSFADRLGTPRRPAAPRGVIGKYGGRITRRTPRRAGPSCLARAVDVDDAAAGRRAARRTAGPGCGPSAGG